MSSAFPDEADLRVAAARMLGRSTVELARIGGGGNNRLYRLTAGAEQFALKSYDAGVRDVHSGTGIISLRLQREWAGLEFLTRHGIDNVPAPLARDDARNLALYSWIDGVPAGRTPEARRPGDITALAGFALTLHELRHQDDAAGLMEAAEACLSAAELLVQLDRRTARLLAVADEPTLAAFLTGRLIPARQAAEQRMRELYAAAGLDPAAPLPARSITLSPSDFGFHNALVHPDGSLAFVDFEYFGRDDPVKLAADTCLHPGHALSAAEQAQWLELHAVTLQRDDPAFSTRLAALLPLYRLRWCLILLNVFLPERRQRQQFAGADTAGTRQLAGAATMLTEAVPAHLQPGRPTEL